MYKCYWLVSHYNSYAYVGIYYNSEYNGILILYIIIYLGLKTRKPTYYYIIFIY